jgi:excisionase family DNA binding protein
MNLITKKRAAEILGVSVRTVDRYIDDGHLRRFKAPGDPMRAPVRVELAEVAQLYRELNATPVASGG